VDALRGRVFADRYRIDERIGDGAMGVVYRARHVKLDRSFAVKVLHAQLLANDKVRRRFEREAEVAAKLRHENVIGVVDVGETPEGLRYLVMDFVEGETLGTVISRGAMAPARVIELARQLCEGLQHAHDAGLIHRDFKPDNVMVERDRDGAETPRIVDFGIALLRDEASQTERERLTTAGVVLGTPHYMAPEHATGGQVDHRIDLFALGVICFEMMTGRLPFAGEGAEVARANMMFEPPPMRVVAPGVDIDPLLEAFTRKLMARAVVHRIQSARAARELLDLVEKDRDAAAIALGIAPRPKSPTQRPLLAMPVVGRTRAANTDVPESATSTVNTDELDTRKMPQLRRTRAWIAAAAVLVALATIVVAMRVLSKPPPRPTAIVEPALLPPPAPALPPAPAIVTPAAVEPPPPARVVTPAVVEPPPPARVVTPSSKLAKRPPSTSPPVALPMPSTTTEEPDRTPTAAEVAQFYAAVGRKLSALEKARGLPATLDLWPRYRNIRIQALLERPEDRRRGTARLQEIERAVDAATRDAP
jgi:serine/threonine-protein kinase